MALYRELEEKRPELARRVIFMSGGAYTPQSREFVDSHHRPVVKKPFDRDQLMAALAACLPAAAE
jgi:hypothetical protein